MPRFRRSHTNTGERTCYFTSDRSLVSFEITARVQVQSVQAPNVEPDETRLVILSVGRISNVDETDQTDQRRNSDGQMTPFCLKVPIVKREQKLPCRTAKAGKNSIITIFYVRNKNNIHIPVYTWFTARAVRHLTALTRARHRNTPFVHVPAVDWQPS